MKMFMRVLILGCCTAMLVTAAFVPERTKREMGEDDATKCRNACPADVGCLINDQGNAECVYRSACESGLGPCEAPPTPQPPTRNRREMSEDDGTKCRNACPADVGCLINDQGNAECVYSSACESGLGPCGTPPTPPAPNRNRREMTPEQRTFCVNNCQDVGCIVNNEGKAECDYSISIFNETPSPPQHD